MLPRLWLTIVMMSALTAPAPGKQGPRPVRLADGDSFTLGSERYRLYGIDAPELHQECTDAKGRKWPCGTRARSELRRIIATDPVQCETMSIDRYGRRIATCLAGGRDLSEEMVRSGYATAYERRGSNRYEAAEAEARREKRGVWAGDFERPSDWRRAHPRDPDVSAPEETPRAWLDRTVAALWQAVMEWLRAFLGR